MGTQRCKSFFRAELGEDAAASLDAPFAMGEQGVLEALFHAADVADVSFTSIPGSGRFDSIDQWVTTEVRGWSIGDSVSDRQLADLNEVARNRLSRFETSDGCEFGMTAKVASWAT